MSDRTNQHVKILGGMPEFVGRTGTILCKEHKLYRVKLDEPVEIPNVGLVHDDLWEGKLLRRLRQRRRITTESEVQTKPRPVTTKPNAPATKPAASIRYAGSTAEKMDNALMQGGDLGELAEAVGVTKGMLRSHAKYRAKNPTWTLRENGDEIKMTKVATAV